MTKENQPYKAPYYSRSIELKVSHRQTMSEQIDPIDILINQNVGELSTYKRVNSDNEWSSFMKMVKP